MNIGDINGKLVQTSRAHYGPIAFVMVQVTNERLGQNSFVQKYNNNINFEIIAIYLFVGFCPKLVAIA